MNYAERDAIADGMPRNAVATGHVHYDGTPTQIVASILSFPRVHEQAMMAYRPRSNVVFEASRDGAARSSVQIFRNMEVRRRFDLTI